MALTRDDILRALAGDRTALTALVGAVLPAIKVEAAMALVRRAGAQRRDPRQDIEDFAHDVLVHLLADGGKLLKLWDPRRGRSLASFVRLITRQRVSRALHGHRGNPWGDDPTEATDLESLVGRDEGGRLLESREELRSLLERLRAHLDERGLVLFQRIYVEQVAIAEVAAELGMSREAVDAWNSRIRARVRRMAVTPPAQARP